MARRRTYARETRAEKWLAWGIRLLIPAIGLGAWQAYTDLQTVKRDLAVLTTKLDQHQRSLSAIWQRLGQPVEPVDPPPPPVAQDGGEPKPASE